MLGVFANHPDDAFTLDYLAFVTNFFNRRSHFHVNTPETSKFLFLFISVCFLTAFLKVPPI